MKLRFLMAFAPISLSACSMLPSLPPEHIPYMAVPVRGPDRPVDPVSATQESWRPYSAGPLQNRFERPSARNGTDWGRAPTSSRGKVERSPLPSTETSKAQASGWPVYASKPQPSAPGDALSSFAFGTNVTSAWASEYVPEGFRDEFAIFAQKTAKDGQARMTMPTGEVYMASVTERDGRCSTLEVSVTADGDLPIISRGIARVCR